MYLKIYIYYFKALHVYNVYECLFLIYMYYTYMCMMHMYMMCVYGRDPSGLSEDKKKVILLFSQFLSS